MSGMVRPDEQIARAVAALVPGARVVGVERLGADPTVDDTHKATGYGEPRRIRVRSDEGEQSFVLHVQRADSFGHDRRADRAAEQLLAFDTFARIPRHAAALDVGAIGEGGRLISLAGAGEFYLITEWVDGTPYADDLRRIARTHQLEPLDLARLDALVDHLVALHAERRRDPAVYRRALRDLVGDGEGIFGMTDAYPADTPGAPPARLQAIERACLDWRWRLRGRTDRLTTTHGDFHPFNIVFGDGVSYRLLDASRGCVGDAADDVTALAINFVFFAIDHPGAWHDALGVLWRRFFDRYIDASGDDELCAVLAPFLAWRGLVVASPVFYPALPVEARDRLLRLVERALAAPRFDPTFGDAVFA